MGKLKRSKGFKSTNEYHLLEDEKRDKSSADLSGIRGHFLILIKALHYLLKTPNHQSKPQERFCKVIRLALALHFLFLARFTSLAGPVALKSLANGLAAPQPQFLWKALLAFVGARFLTAAFSAAQDAIFARAGAEAERAAALELFSHLQSLGPDFHLRRKTGAVVRAVSRGASSFAVVTQILFFQLLPILIQVGIVSVYLLLAYPWWLTMIALAALALYMLYTLTTTEWRNQYRRVMNQKDNDFNQKAVDALLNFETVKYFNAERHEIERYDSALREYAIANGDSQQILALLSTGQEFVISLGFASVLYVTGMLVVSGKNNLTIGDFLLIQELLSSLFQPLSSLGKYYRSLKKSLIDIESMMRLLKEKITVQDDPRAVDLEIRQGKIEFQNVSFAYSNDFPILKSISFTVEHGQSLGIVGLSGAGKSTIVRLLYRFYDVQAGRILIDGQDISHVTQDSLRKAIGIVPQDCALFNDSISYNIGYGMFARKPQGASAEEIEQAAKLASIHEFIMSQPKQYETPVGERGLRLSGGEKQRVAIARSILKDPKIMLFDEATSALDSWTESLIQESLHKLSMGRSSIIIAHRLSTITRCDKIIVLKNGIVSEQGTHEELLALDADYARLWEKQNKSSRRSSEEVEDVDSSITGNSSEEEFEVKVSIQ